MGLGKTGSSLVPAAAILAQCQSDIAYTGIMDLLKGTNFEIKVVRHLNPTGLRKETRSHLVKPLADEDSYGLRREPLPDRLPRFAAHFRPLRLRQRTEFVERLGNVAGAAAMPRQIGCWAGRRIIAIYRFARRFDDDSVIIVDEIEHRRMPRRDRHDPVRHRFH